MAPPQTPRFTLKQGRVYGWTMYPGYGDTPYRSPISVRGFRPLGLRRFDLDFLNIFYASGVQHMGYRLRTLRREEAYLVAEQIERDGKLTDRVVVIERLTRDWMHHAAPKCTHLFERLFDTEGEPVPTEFERLAS